MMVTRIFNRICVMKKAFKVFFVFAAAALTLAGCQRNEMEQSEQGGPYKYSFAIADDTRAVIGDNSVEWVAGDQVGMFLGDFKGYAKVDVTSTPKMVVLYSTSAIPAGTMAYAYAPYDEANKTSDAQPDWVKINLSKVQSGAAVSAMPLAGVPFEVENEIDPRAQSGNGKIKFMNLGSLVNFKIFSTDEAFRSETVQSVKFEASKPIAGVGYIDLTSVDVADEGTLELLMDEEETSVRVDQEASIPATKEDAAPIKMVVLPGTFEGILTVTTDVATYMKEIPEREFARSHSRTFSLDLAKAEREEGVEETVVSLPYEEAFTSSLGEFKAKNVLLPEGQTNLWVSDAQYGAKVTASINGTSYDSEAWLISPWMDLTEAFGAVVSFDHAGNYFSSNAAKERECTFWALGDAKGAEWKQLTIGEYFNSWTFVNSGDISLNAYVGGKVKVAFKYTSTSTKAGTWEIKNFSARIVKADPEIYFEETEFEADVKDDFTAPILENPHGVEVTYSSSDEEIAMVDEKTGEVVFMGEDGLVTITASFAGNDIFAPASAYYTIMVHNSAIEPETFFYESFDQFYGDCTGGNDGKWSGSIANYAIASYTTDEGGWTYKSANAAYLCAKIGTGSADGYMTTRSIVVKGKAKLSFKAGGWGDSNANIVTVTATGATLSGDTDVTLKNGVFNSYLVRISEAAGDVVLTFSGHRFFIDEIAVFTGEAPIKPSERLDPDLAFEGESSYIVEPGASFSAPKLVNPYDLPVTYSSSNVNVAQVDETTGEVTIGENQGQAVITASFVGTAAYNAGSASYTIIVRDGDSPIVDVLDLAFTGVKNNANYTDWSGKTGASSAVYAGNSTGNNGAIQLRSDNKNSGIVTTKSGGNVRKIVVVWATNTANRRSVDFYGSHTPFTSASELYSAETQGTYLGSLVYEEGARAAYVLTISGDYEYIGFRSNNGALYLTEVDITWQ